MLVIIVISNRSEADSHSTFVTPFLVPNSAVHFYLNTWSVFYILYTLVIFLQTLLSLTNNNHSGQHYKPVMQYSFLTLK